jgi:hypothetical protein
VEENTNASKAHRDEAPLRIYLEDSCNVLGTINHTPPVQGDEKDTSRRMQTMTQVAMRTFLSMQSQQNPTYLLPQRPERSLTRQPTHTQETYPNAERAAHITDRKKYTTCKNCGQRGHWGGDPECRVKCSESSGQRPPKRARTKDLGSGPSTKRPTAGHISPSWGNTQPEVHTESAPGPPPPEADFH